jgi:eukaryotic-like serine/threonine-protein kinase
MNVGPGQILAGKYRLMSMLGQGGMGSVWRAEHLALRSPVAVKLIDPAYVENEEACSRFMREAQSAAALRSPHVVQILDYGMDEGTPYIVMELMEGESLASRLERSVTLSPADAARVMTDVCRAVGRAHQAGIVHRDLKPDNIFLVPNDESEIAKVLDFGIAKSAMPGMTPGSGTRTGTMLGTPYYMSPEQASGSKSVDWRSDLWSLAIIAFECITGVRPFNSDTLGALVLSICVDEIPVPSRVARVPIGFDEWFTRAADRVPDRRFQSAKELAQTLSAVCGHGVGQVPSDSQFTGTAGGGRTQVVSKFVTTTGAGAMATTGVGASTVRVGRNPSPAVVGSVLAVVLCVTGFVGWKLLSSKLTSAPAVSGATATSSPPALSAASASTISQVPVQPSLPATPSVSLAPAASAAVITDPKSNRTPRPTHDASHHTPLLPRPIGAQQNPTPPAVPTPPNNQTKPPNAPANPDPLGI